MPDTIKFIIYHFLMMLYTVGSMKAHPITAQKKIYTITEITKDLKELIEDNFHSVWLKGEISNFKASASGHYYFTLKDEKSQISAVMFKGYNKLLKFELDDGMSIIVHGRLSLYEVRGQYQILVDHVEPEGIGALQLAFEQLKEKLKKEGLFAEERKRALPYLPQIVGIVTSLHGAAVHDMITVLKRRYENIHIMIYPVKVQGEGSAKEIVQAIDYFSHNKNVDVLIVGRGGGSLEDLWSFNEEIVARAIATCSVPVISAVGHETDFSISDFVADQRAPTPSAAAEISVPVKEDLVHDIKANRDRLNLAIHNQITNSKKEVAYLVKSLPTPQNILDRLMLKLGDYEDRLYQNMVLRIRNNGSNLRELEFKLTSPEDHIRGLKRDVLDAKKSLTNVLEKYLTGLQHKLQNHNLKINLLSPQNVLKRGYILAKNKEGKVVTRRKGLKPGDEMALTFYDGELPAKILEAK